jgi:carbonic anhydrase
MIGQFLYLSPALAQNTGPMTGAAALQLLLDGNKRFAAGQSQYPDQGVDRRKTVAAGQTPLAFVLGCYDSRVSHELVFDQGLGDIFSSRTAGNLIDDAVMGGIEFGVEEFKVPLLVIMGHQRCGAVKATVDALASGASAPGSIGRVVELIRPAVELARSRPGDLLDNSVRANVELGVATLNDSDLLAETVNAGNLVIVGARYSLDTGQVEIIA